MCDTVHENAKYINVLVLQKQLLTKHDERKKDYKALFTFKIRWEKFSAKSTKQ